MLLHCCGRLILSVLRTRTLGITIRTTLLHPTHFFHLLSLFSTDNRPPPLQRTIYSWSLNTFLPPNLSTLTCIHIIMILFPFFIIEEPVPIPWGIGGVNGGDANLTYIVSSSFCFGILTHPHILSFYFSHQLCGLK